MSSALLHAMKARALAAAAACLFLTACSGGKGGDDPDGPQIAQFRSDSGSYFVGETAKLTPVFSNGSGRIEPGDIAVMSGQEITTPLLTSNIRYRLTVSDGTSSVTRDLDLPVQYRQRMRSIAAPARSEHAAAALRDGRVIIFGGEENGASLPAEIYAFNPATETFALFGSLSTGRIGFTAVPLYDGDVLVVGGLTGLMSAPQAEVIDGTTGAVRATNGAPARRRTFAAATKLMDGRVLLSGGLVPVEGITSSVEMYDPQARTFTLLPGGLRIGRAAHTIVRIDDRKFLVYGGVTIDNVPAPPELYDPATGNSTLLAAPESSGRYNHVAHTVQDGTVWILGGEDYDALPFASVQRFDPATSTFLQSFNLATPRSSTAVARLADARVIIIGGNTAQSATSATQTTELLTAPTQRNDGPLLNTRRWLHTATRLDNGKVLVVGGLNERQEILATAEIFE